MGNNVGVVCDVLESDEVASQYLAEGPRLPPADLRRGQGHRLSYLCMRYYLVQPETSEQGLVYCITASGINSRNYSKGTMTRIRVSTLKQNKK